MSTTLLERSPAVTRPYWYCCWISTTSASASSRMPFLVSGMIMSSMPIDTPARVAYAKPVYISWSEHDRVLQAEQAVAGVDQATDVLLGQLDVGQLDRQALGQDQIGRAHV